MFVPGAECIRVMRAASADPHATAPIPIADVLRFSQARDIRHRVRVQGTVTYPSASGPTWVRDATGGVVIQDHDGDALAVGDLVDVVGFPEIAGFGSGLRGAHVKRLQSGPPPGPVRITAENALKGDFDGQLVEIDGRLIDRLAQPTEQVLAVESGKVIFDAILPGTSATLPLQAGTRLRLTGICSVETEQLQEVIRPRRFRLLLRSAADVAILSRPPWLNADRLVPIAAGGALLVITGLAWVGLLRKRVRDQTVALRAQTVQLMIAHEKTRLALQKAREAESLDLDSEVVSGRTDQHLANAMDSLQETFRAKQPWKLSSGMERLLGRKRGTAEYLGKFAAQLRDDSYTGALRNAAALLDSVEIDRLRVKPIVKITGEFWAQTTEGDGNFHMFQFLEREGAQVLVEPIGTWIMYMLHQVIQKYRDTKGLEEGVEVPSLWNLPSRARVESRFMTKLAKLKLAEVVFKREYHRLANTFGGLIHHLANQYELQRLGHPFYNSRAGGGEGHLEVAKNIYYANRNLAHMVLSLKPFGCASRY